MTRDRGQSETLGAILLVAITVIAISTVAGALFTANTPSEHPNARIEATADGTNLSVEHRAGQPIHEDDFEIVLQDTGTTMAGTDGEPDEALSDADAYFEPGEVWIFEAGYTIADGEDVLLIYTGEDRVLLDETGVGFQVTVTTADSTTTTTEGTSEPTSTATPTTTTATTTTTTPTTTTTTTTAPNDPPNANAGGPYTVEKKGEISLDGAGSEDPDGSIETYAWEIVTEGGNVGSLSGADTATPTYSAPNGNVPDGVTVRLIVTDNDGATDTETESITVQVGRG
ncbi:Cell surface protein [Halanaeroarchaeum sp. HSR-CO]|uniref:type IV pilin N-terminal domain-containing protein n=1 Tax=Halanaeroarchaeum sp. HSR-CO TaxID=2866382 RepID=UPI00217DE3AC|nr:type IV pilin [Halanaeroarchaeum sp. HSR-CO]UWG48571.1 Cell surface protein [Halanaeroarchaeum sp. HSR-CO]